MAVGVVDARTAGGKHCNYLEKDFTVERVLEGASRVVWSPDGNRVAFMAVPGTAGTLGDGAADAYELTLKTGEVRCLTCAFSQKALRVHYLPTGDFILIGPDPAIATLGNVVDRFHTQLFFLPSALDRAPQPLDAPNQEGLAVQRDGDQIAWMVFLPYGIPNVSEVWVGRVEVKGERAEIVDRRRVLSYPGPGLGVNVFPFIEPQDFFPGGDALLLNGPSSNSTLNGNPTDIEAFRLDLASGTLTNVTNSPTYDEAEGMSPDGRFAFIETDRRTRRSFINIDLWVMELDGSGQHVRPIIEATESGTAHNATVSPDGRHVAADVVEADWAGLILVNFNC